MKKQEALKLIDRLSSSVSAPKEFTPSSLAIQVEFFLDLDYEEALASVNKFLITDGKFYPSPAQIRLPIFEAKFPSTVEAWREVKRLISETRNFEVPRYSHSLIEMAARIIGWQTFRSSENIAFEERRFQQIYDDLRKSEVNRMNLESLQAGGAE